MRKNITKGQIVETTLELMKNKNDLRGLNLREIARALGCAHTNLYNYFPAYDDLLWEAHIALLKIFMESLIKKLDAAETAELRFSCFFEAFVNLYLDNKGWFRLAWHEYIGKERPRRDTDETEAVNKALNKHISEIWKAYSGKYPDADTIKRVLHNTHCYMVGEISNYLLGRGLIDDEAELKAYITREATHMFKVCVLGA